MLRPASNGSLSLEHGDLAGELREIAGEARAQLRLVRRIVGLAVAGAAAVAAAVTVGGAASGDWRVLPILSGSMEPAFAAGDAVVAERAPLSSVRKGDVIVYRIPVGDRQVTAHRVIEIVRGGATPVVRTKGDANEAADPWVAQLQGDAVWRVRADVPLVGHAFLFVNRPWTRTAVIWAALAAALLGGLRAVWTRPHERRRHVHVPTATAH